MTAGEAGPGGKVIARTVDRPWHHETALKTRDWGTVTADLTGVSDSQTWTSLDDGAGVKWRTTSSSVTHDTVAGRVTQVDDRGDTATAADNQCVRTTYATNADKNILLLPSRVETVTEGTPDGRSPSTTPSSSTVPRPAYGVPHVGSVWAGLRRRAVALSLGLRHSHDRRCRGRHAPCRSQWSQLRSEYRSAVGDAWWHDPLGGLAGEGSDHVEVAVVVEYGQPVQLRCGGDEKVGE